MTPDMLTNANFDKLKYLIEAFTWKNLLENTNSVEIYLGIFKIG